MACKQMVQNDAEEGPRNKPVTKTLLQMDCVHSWKSLWRKQRHSWVVSPVSVRIRAVWSPEAATKTWHLFRMSYECNSEYIHWVFPADLDLMVHGHGFIQRRSRGEDMTNLITTDRMWIIKLKSLKSRPLSPVLPQTMESSVSFHFSSKGSLGGHGLYSCRYPVEKTPRAHH